MPRKKYITPSPRCLKVNSPRNSECGVPLSYLDWSDWYTGTGLSGTLMILHVRQIYQDNTAIHRVYCRHADKPRLKMKNGELYWLVDPGAVLSKD